MPAPDELTESELLIGPDELRRRRTEEKPRNWVPFGPTHGFSDNTEANRIAKDSAWRHVLERGAGDETGYLRSIEEIKEEAMEGYDSSLRETLKSRPDVFVEMMARDGCYFLQLALHILGAGDLLGYPPSNPYFGIDSVYPSSCIPAMFFVGNQIPYVVIDALMKQPFFNAVINALTTRPLFKAVIENATWRRPAQEDPVRLALYQTVVEPQLAKAKKRHRCHEPPSNVLTELRNVLLGSEHDGYPNYYEMMEIRDLEEAGGSEEEDKFPSAGKLYKSGIRLRKNNNGINGICFKTNLGLLASLYLPTFILFDDHTWQVLNSLINHEPRLDESKREVTAYIRLLRDLIPTYKDFKILEMNGIIRGKGNRLKPAILRMLDHLVSLHDPKFTPGIRKIRRKIRDHEVVPWRQISFTYSIACGVVTFIIAVLTIVQTVFSVLSYYNSRN